MSRDSSTSPDALSCTGDRGAIVDPPHRWTGKRRKKLALDVIRDARTTFPMDGRSARRHRSSRHMMATHFLHTLVFLRTSARRVRDRQSTACRKAEDQVRRPRCRHGWACAGGSRRLVRLDVGPALLGRRRSRATSVFQRTGHLAPTAPRSPLSPAATSGRCRPPAATRGCSSRTPRPSRGRSTRPTATRSPSSRPHRRRRHLRADARHRRRCAG